MNRLLEAINNKLFYRDRLFVKRARIVVQPNGSKRQIYADVSSLQNIPCAFSSNSHASSFPNRPLIEQSWGYKIKIFKRIFCGNEYNLLVGDQLKIVTHNGCEKTFIIGEPMCYENHQEILLERECEA